MLIAIILISMLLPLALCFSICGGSSCGPIDEDFDDIGTDDGYGF